MKIEGPTAPTLAEFKEASRREFAFLLGHGFEEVPPPRKEYSNPFEVHFLKNGWRIIVEGHSYGFGASLSIGAPDGRTGYFHYLVDNGFWESNREGLGRGQIGALKYQRLCLKTFGGRMIAGDWGEFDAIVSRHAQWQFENERAQKRNELERRMNRAIDQAKELFLDCRYSEAARLLRPFREHLPPAQQKRLAIAERRGNG